MNSKFLRGSLIFLSASVASEVLWQLYVYFRKKTGIEEGDEETRARNIRKPPDLWNTVLFFPDKSTTTGRNSWPGPSTSQSQLLAYVESAKICVKICIYLASFSALERIILKKKTDGLCIQVITDLDTMTAHNNSNCHTFRRAGIPVRIKKTGYLMHNKFIIIDDEALLTGSLNWTRQALANNSENAVVTTNPRIVTTYRLQFEKLWRESEDSTEYLK